MRGQGLDDEGDVGLRTCGLRTTGSHQRGRSRTPPTTVSRNWVSRESGESKGAWGSLSGNRFYWKGNRSEPGIEGQRSSRHLPLPASRASGRGVGPLPLRTCPVPDGVSRTAQVSREQPRALVSGDSLRGSVARGADNPRFKSWPRFLLGV